MQIDGKTIYLRLLRQVLPYWRTFALAVLSMLVLGLTEPALAALLKPTFDGSFVDKDLETVGLMSVLLVLLFLVRGASSYLSHLALASVASRVVLELRRRMFAKLVTLPSEIVHGSTTGTFVSKFTYDASQVTEAATQVVMVLVRDSILVAGLLGVMLYHNWKLTLAALLTAPAVVLVVRHFSLRLRNVSLELQRLMGDATHVVQEVIEGQKVVRGFGAQAQETKRFDKIANRVRQFEIKFASAAWIIPPIAQLVTACGLAVLLYLAAREVTLSGMTVGTFASFFAAMGLLFSPLKRLTGVNARLQRGIAAAASVFGIIDQAPEPDSGTRTMARAQGHIRLENVSFRYATGEVRAISHIDLDIEPGGRFALVGPSGSGKSTIANLIPRFYHPDEGRILLDGVDISELTLESLRRQIAMVSQDVVLFEGSVRDNIAYGPLSQCDEHALWQAIDAANAREFIEALPNGLGTAIGQNGLRLSGGQRQRLAIARAFLKDAPVLILDEATSALDTQSEREIQRALQRLSEGRTTIVIAHRLSSIESMDSIVVLEGGRIIDIGSHTQLLERNGLYASLYRQQFGQPPMQRRALEAG